jgi:hypothetical protein
MFAKSAMKFRQDAPKARQDAGAALGKAKAFLKEITYEAPTVISFPIGGKKGARPVTHAGNIGGQPAP